MFIIILIFQEMSRIAEVLQPAGKYFWW